MGVCTIAASQWLIHAFSYQTTTISPHMETRLPSPLMECSPLPQRSGSNQCFEKWSPDGAKSHSNHVTSSKQADTIICHTTMCRNPINFLYNQGHMILWCVEVGLVANVWEDSTQEYDWAMMGAKYDLALTWPFWLDIKTHTVSVNLMKFSSHLISDNFNF